MPSSFDAVNCDGVSQFAACNLFIRTYLLFTLSSSFFFIMQIGRIGQFARPKDVLGREKSPRH